MREFVKHVMVVKPEGLPGAAAISTGDSIYISDTAYKHYIFAHEMSHSIDSHQEVPGVTPAGQGGISNSDHWRNEYSLDSATTSSYAQTSWAEKVGRNTCRILILEPCFSKSAFFPTHHHG